MNPTCPVCQSSSTFLFTLSREKILNGLNAFFGVKFSPSIVKADYRMLKCDSCTLEFSDPLLPGDDEFYTALVTKQGYYPHSRPEYAVVADLIEKTGNPSVSVLDIGCGGGDFLEVLQKRNLKNIAGLDATESSVEMCAKKGITAYRGKIEEFDKGPFDVIVSFHCLEHVDNPVGFVEAALKKLAPNGMLCISTPYSPQTHEYAWYHPLNYPPHHLLRLNERSYRKIAERTGTSIEFNNFHTTSFNSLFRGAFSFAVYGQNLPGSAAKMMLRMAAHPFTALKIFRKMLSREKINGKVAGNDILVILRKK